MEVDERLRESVIVDKQSRTAYILKELRGSPDIFVLISNLKKDGILSTKFVEYEEFMQLKDEVGTYIGDEEEERREEFTSSDVLNEFASIIRRAVQEKVSDIHIKTDNKKGEVYIRKNGMLVHMASYGKEFTQSMMRAFYQNLAVSESNYVETEYQVAQFKREDINIDIPPEILSIRVQRGPKLNGQFMVLRLLYADTRRTEIAPSGEEERLALGVRMLTDYGYLERQAKEIVKVARQSAGIGVVAGPTGSGKSTALKTVLEFQHIIYPWKAIYTIEDPPEYPIRGAVQLPVMGKDRGGKFAQALKVCMRSDPDIIMVGEVRDPETADLAVNASLTGHQVWTTVHAVHTFAVFPRLEGLGVPSDKLIETGVLKLVIAQRLLPKLCECKVKVVDDRVKKRVDTDVLTTVKAWGDNVYVKNPQGCPKCKGTGIAGRVVVAEVLPVTSHILEEIKNRGSGPVYEEWKKENVDMLKHGLVRVLSGEVDPLDLIAYVGDFTQDDMKRAEQIWQE